MRITIDAAGRVVIPKTLREELGLTAGAAIELRVREGVLELEPAPTPMRLRKSIEGVEVVADADLPPLTDEIVRATLERTRR